MKSLICDMATKRSATSSTSTPNSQTLYRHISTQMADANKLTSSAPPLISIAAWNCRGLATGLPYVEFLADLHDIVVLSEHWLWPFELSKLCEAYPNTCGHAVADSHLTAIFPEGVVEWASFGRNILKPPLYLELIQIESVLSLLNPH